MPKKRWVVALTIGVIAATTPPALSKTPNCLFHGQVRNIAGQKSSCVYVNGQTFWISYKKRAENKLSAYEKTKLKAYNQIKNAAGNSITNMQLRYEISKYFPAPLKVEYIRQTEQAAKLYDQFFTRPVVVNNYFQTEKDAAFIKSHPVLKRDSESFDSWFKAWEAGKDLDHNSGLAAWFFNSGGKSEAHSGVVLGSKTSKARLGLYSQQVVAHELFHTVQDFHKLDRDQKGYESMAEFDKYYPPVFREGSANTISTAVAMESFEDYLLFYQTFLTQKKDQYAPKIFTRINSVPNTVELLKEMSVREGGDQDVHEASYSMGSLLFEWVIAEYGFEGYKKLVQNQIVGNSFEDNVKTSLGLTLDQLYKAAAPHILAGFAAAKGSTR